VSHGLYTAAIAIPGVESEDAWIAFHDASVAHLDPVGPIEHALASRIAEVLWRIRRAGRAESRAIEVAPVNVGAPPRCIPDEKSLNMVIRYEAHLSRQLFQAMHELEASQRLRNGEEAPLARLDVASAQETSEAFDALRSSAASASLR
jgi:hypothetical protein